jgi:hypothetical protein
MDGRRIGSRVKNPPRALEARFVEIERFLADGIQTKK